MTQTATTIVLKTKVFGRYFDANPDCREQNFKFATVSGSGFQYPKKWEIFL